MNKLLRYILFSLLISVSVITDNAGMAYLTNYYNNINFDIK